MCVVSYEEIIGSYTNSVTAWESDGSIYGETEHTQKAEYTEPKDERSWLSKDGSYSANDKMLSYEVVINPGADDLLPTDDPEQDYLTFTDEVVEQAGSLDQYELNLQRTSVKFWKLSELKAADGTINGEPGTYIDADGNEVIYAEGDDSFYVYTDAGTGIVTVYTKELMDIDWTYETYFLYQQYYVITATVPDETAILVEYQYRLYYKDGADENYSLNLNNTAKLNGETDDEGSKHIVDEIGDTHTSGGMMTDDTLTIYKVEKGSYGVLLPDAEFTLYMWDEDYVNEDGTKGAWVNTTIVFTSNENGIITVTKDDFVTEDGTNYFNYNTAYYLVETKAPVNGDDGYLLDESTKVYFYWSRTDDNGNLIDKDGKQMSSEAFPEHFSGSDLTNNVTFIDVENEKEPLEEVKVEKLWKYVHDDGSTTDAVESDLPDEVTVQLWYYLSETRPEGWVGENPTHSGHGYGGEEGSGSSDYITVYYEYQGVQYVLGTVRAGYDVYITIDNTDNDGYVGCTWYSLQRDYDHEISNTQVEPGKSSTITISSSYGEYTEWDILIKDNYGNVSGPDLNHISVSSAYTPSTEEGGDGDSGNTDFSTGPFLYGEYTLNAANGWSQDINDLPEYMFDEDGTLYWYYYYFVEVDVPSGWTSSYTTSGGTYTVDENGNISSGSGVDGIEGDDGTVTITNTKPADKAYQLPKAGGMGTRRLTLFGVMAMVLGAGVLLYRDNRRKRGCER